ncbi:hypothetical protein [Halotia branconii]|uniref:Uncharacterized protein n=1 Tax=Halotia branconii CENA392 TaxID=1539056 RepID=A0AAJ6NUK2_9CYAN|nr:hypothetical protein [Halotia branconii]WGV27004.1 hypothetical protein QI031_05790 [Halotia branconii CENA392]
MKSSNVRGYLSSKFNVIIAPQRSHQNGKKSLSDRVLNFTSRYHQVLWLSCA